MIMLESDEGLPINIICDTYVASHKKSTTSPNPLVVRIVARIEGKGPVDVNVKEFSCCQKRSRDLQLQ